MRRLDSMLNRCYASVTGPSRTAATTEAGRSHEPAGVPDRRRHTGCVRPRRSLAFPQPTATSKDISMLKCASFVVLFVWCLAAPAFAQFETATVVGTVRDSSGAVVAGRQGHADQYPDRRQRRAHVRRERQLRVLHGADRHLSAQRREGGLLHRPRRQRAGDRRRAAARRSDDGGRPAVSEKVEVSASAVHPADRFVGPRTGHHRRADPLHPAQRPRILGAGAAVARRAQLAACGRRPRGFATTSTACARPSTTSSSTASTTTPTARATRASPTR